MANRLMSRAFTAREKVLILVLAVLLLGASYYFFVVQNVADTKEANAAKIADVEDQIAIQATLATIRSQMQSELEGLGSPQDLPLVGTYDNLRNEVDELNGVLAQAITYDLKFDQPTLEGELVRRKVSLMYSTKTYDESLAIIESLQNGKYRCDITDFSLNGVLMADGSADTVAATLSITYYESSVGATSLGGLIQKKWKLKNLTSQGGDENN